MVLKGGSQVTLTWSRPTSMVSPSGGGGSSVLWLKERQRMSEYRLVVRERQRMGEYRLVERGTENG